MNCSPDRAKLDPGVIFLLDIAERYPGYVVDGAALMRYAVVIEKAEDNYSAYVPDLPGCIATGESVQDVEEQIREAIRFHIDGLKADGLAIPQPTSIADYVDA